jgi:hypothetical protein
MTQRTKRLLAIMLFALLNSVLAFILLDYLVIKLKIWQYISIELVIVAMHFLLGLIKIKVDKTFPLTKEEQEESEDDFPF